MRTIRGILKTINMENKNKSRQIKQPCEELRDNNLSLFNHENQVYSVLHIDDDEPTLYISKTFLETLAPNLLITSESDAANINSWMNTDFDCYLVDYSMPKSDGLIVCKKIRELKNTPIILFTSKEQDEIPYETFEQMDVRYLQKNSDPCNYRQLTEAIYELVNRDLEKSRLLPVD